MRCSYRHGLFPFLFPSPPIFFTFLSSWLPALLWASLFPCLTWYLLVCARGIFVIRFVSFRFAQKKYIYGWRGVEARGGGASVFERKERRFLFSFFGSVLGL